MVCSLFISAQLNHRQGDDGGDYVDVDYVGDSFVKTPT